MKKFSVWLKTFVLLLQIQRQPNKLEQRSISWNRPTVKTVTLLSRFRNCISCTDTQRYITLVAKEVAEQEQDRVFCPFNVHMGVFTEFAVDNLDFHENSLDGKTTHGTTHILYQYQSDPSTQTQANVPVQRSCSVSIDAPEICEPMQSMLTPNVRKQGRSIRGMKL